MKKEKKSFAQSKHTNHSPHVYKDVSNHSLCKHSPSAKISRPIKNHSPTHTHNVTTIRLIENHSPTHIQCKKYSPICCIAAISCSVCVCLQCKNHSCNRKIFAPPYTHCKKYSPVFGIAAINCSVCVCLQCQHHSRSRCKRIRSISGSLRPGSLHCCVSFAKETHFL